MSEKASMPQTMEVPQKAKAFYAILMFIGLITFLITLQTDSERAWHAYLVGLFYFVTISVGGLFFTAIQHATKAGWSVTVRRFCEGLTAFLPFGLALGAIYVFFGSGTVYEWLHPEVVQNDAILTNKASYLNFGFFAFRFFIFFGLWIVFSKLIVGKSLKQDESGDVNLTHKLVPISVGFIVVFALSYSLFSIDFLMSLEPHWFSTIFGVYTFAGLFQSTIAVMILIIAGLMKKGALKGYVDENHLHDLGKYLFGFTVFWAYIAFSQYMLIWYANLPEETTFFIPRTTGSWLYVSLFLMIFKFIVPFFALLPQWVKRSPSHLSAVAALILGVQFVDIYWLVYPSYSHEHVSLSLVEIGVFAGFAGLFSFVVSRFFSKHSLVPHKDPRIHEAVHHHVVY